MENKTIREEDLKELKELEELEELKSQIKELDKWLEDNPYDYAKDDSAMTYFHSERWKKEKEQQSYLDELNRKLALLEPYIEDKYIEDMMNEDNPMLRIGDNDPWENEYDDYLDDGISEEVYTIRRWAEDICVIEEPLTCCDELPTPIDHTEEFNKIVGSLEDEIELIYPEEKILSPWYKDEEVLDESEETISK